MLHTEHGMYLHNGFLIMAVVFFVLQGINFVFAPPRVTPRWDSFGFACVVSAFVFPFFV